jgi:PUA-domain protein
MMLEGFKRHHLSKKEARRVLEEARRILGLELPRKVSLELAKGQGLELILLEGTPLFYIAGNRLIPTLHFLLARREVAASMPRIIVDEGAVGPVSRGADVMAPGIVKVEGEFDKGDIVVVVDSRHGIPLAVCEALYSSSEIRGMKRGKVLKNLHHVGDKVWKASPPKRIR